jgi:hypothetical protein
VSERPAVKLELADPAFFAADPRRLKVEEDAVAGRTYFLLKGRVVAVARPDTKEEI